MTTSIVQTGPGAQTEMSRLDPVFFWRADSPGTEDIWWLSNSFNTGIGNRIIIFPYWYLLDYEQDPTDNIRNFDLWIYHRFLQNPANPAQNSPYLQTDLGTVGGTPDFTDIGTVVGEGARVFGLSDVQPGPCEYAEGATLHKTNYEGFSSPDNRVEPMPGAADIPLSGTSPAIVTTALADTAYIGIRFNAFAGPNTEPVSREGEFLKILVSVGGLARTP